MIERKPAHVVG